MAKIITMMYYKIFKPNLSCQGFRFVIGKTYRAKRRIIMCENGFHCCNQAIECLKYYKPPYRLCEVSIGSENYTEGDKTVTREITIVREIVDDEFKSLLTGHVTNFDGVKYWYKDGLLHRENDLPAIECPCGHKEWYIQGKLHREDDMPAKIDYGVTHYWYREESNHYKFPVASDKSICLQSWFKEGKLHRDQDLPAVIYADGSQLWFKEGKLHRDGDLPAKIYCCRYKEWYKNGIKFRDNGLPVQTHLDFDGQEWYRDDNGNKIYVEN